MKKIILVCVLLFMLVGCSNNEAKPGKTETTVNDYIKTDGIDSYKVTIWEDIDLKFKDEAKLNEMLEKMKSLDFKKASETAPSKCGSGKFYDIEPVTLSVTYSDGSKLELSDVCGENIAINGTQYTSDKGEYLNEEIIKLFIDDLAHYDFNETSTFYLRPLNFENDEVILNGSVKEESDLSLDEAIRNFKDLNLKAYENDEEIDELINNDGKIHKITFADEDDNEYSYTYKALE